MVARIVLEAISPDRSLQGNSTEALESTTTFQGLWTSANSPRTVKEGLSRLTVPTPTMIASLSFRKRWACWRERSFEIHFDSPVEVAIFPSRLKAAFTVTKGNPVATNL